MRTAKLAKKINIEILPKMSFGTGHHQTTWMMSKAILDEKLMPETVLDMGTGTGVLAFLVEKLGAKSVSTEPGGPKTNQSSEKELELFQEAIAIHPDLGGIDVSSIFTNVLLEFFDQLPEEQKFEELNFIVI